MWVMGRGGETMWVRCRVRWEMVLRGRACGMGVVVARVAGARGWWVLGRAVSVMMSVRGVLQRAQETTVMCGCWRRGGGT